MHDLFTLNETTGFYDANYSVSGDDIIDMADQILVERLAKPSAECFQHPGDVKSFLKLRLAQNKSEVFSVLFLDNRHHMLAFDEMFYGTIDGASVHPREVVRRALEHNAAAVILAHNHPSGVAEPSRSDTQLTRRLSDALALVDIRVVDHIVVGVEDTVSFAERGLI
jgi:DNA repair protein RadC